MQYAPTWRYLSVPKGHIQYVPAIIAIPLYMMILLHLEKRWTGIAISRLAFGRDENRAEWPGFR